MDRFGPQLAPSGVNWTLRLFGLATLALRSCNRRATRLQEDLEDRCSMAGVDLTNDAEKELEVGAR